MLRVNWVASDRPGDVILERAIPNNVEGFCQQLETGPINLRDCAGWKLTRCLCFEIEVLYLVKIRSEPKSVRFRYAMYPI